MPAHTLFRHRTSNPLEPHRSLRLGIALLAGCLCAAFETVGAQLTGYTFTAVADTAPTSRFSDVSYPVINQRGDVAFAAALRTGGAGIYKWVSATSQIVTIFEDASFPAWNFGTRFVYPALDDAGNVTFQVGNAILRGSGGSLQTLVDDSGSFLLPVAGYSAPLPIGQVFLLSRSADALGRVVVFCDMGGGFGTYLAGSGPLVTLCDFSWIAQTPPNATLFEEPVDISSNGRTAGRGRYAWGSGAPMLLRGGANGLEVLLDESAFLRVGGQSQFGINNSGRVVYQGFQDAGANSGPAIFIVDSANSPVRITDVNGAYRFALTPSINNLNELVWVDGIRNGLFNGPDPVANKIIGFLDHLLNYPGVVVAIQLNHPGINDAGELAFLTHLDDSLTHTSTVVVTRGNPGNNRPPVIDPIADQATPEGLFASLQVSATDPEGDNPLHYGINVAPAPSNPGAPLFALTIDSAGLITGTPGPGTRGFTYDVTVVVEDARHKQSSMGFRWSVKPPGPAPRTGLTATSVPARECIALSWTNPPGDTADYIQIWRESPSGDVWAATVPAGATSYDYRIDLIGDLYLAVGGQTYCFHVVGVDTNINPAGIPSGPSNSACAIFPLLRIENIVKTVGDTTATITWTTTVPVTILMNVTGYPNSATHTLTPNASLTSFTFTLGNLTPGTIYDLELVAQSLTQTATVQASFTTNAAPPPPAAPAPGSERLQFLGLTVTPTLYSLTFNWRTPFESTAQVQIGPRTAGSNLCSYTQTVNATSRTQRGQTVHTAVFTGLPHSTEFCYRIVLTAVDPRQGPANETQGRTATLEGRPNMVFRVLPDAILQGNLMIEAENRATPTSIPFGHGFANIQVAVIDCAVCSPYPEIIGNGGELSDLAPGERRVFTNRLFARHPEDSISFPILDAGGGRAELRVSWISTYGTVPNETFMRGEQIIPLLLSPASVDVSLRTIQSWRRVPGPNGNGADGFDLTVLAQATGNYGVAVRAVRVSFNPSVHIESAASQFGTCPVSDRLVSAICNGGVLLYPREERTFLNVVIVPTARNTTVGIDVELIDENLDPAPSNNSITFQITRP